MNSFTESVVESAALAWLRDIDKMDRMDEKPLIPIGASVEEGTLAALRDTLLPKGIPGELRVPDAERVVGRVV